MPAMAGVPMGMGPTIIFMSLTSYMVDAYRIFSASALGALSRDTVYVRCLAASGGSAHVSQPGGRVGNSVLGFIALAMIDIPAMFAKYGLALKKKSPYCQQLTEREE